MDYKSVIELLEILMAIFYKNSKDHFDFITFDELFLDYFRSLCI